MEEETLLRRIRANAGALEYDQIYHNAQVVDVFTERIRLMDVAILDGCFCALNPGHHHAKEHVDCKGQYMAPGLLDGHMHIETSHLNPVAWAQATLPHGTTGIFFDAMMSASVYGPEFLTVLKSLLQKVPTRVFYQIPSRIPAKAELETMGGILGPDEVRQLLADPQTVSLGEVNYLSVLQEEPGILAKILSARNQNCLINGHCPEIAPEDINTVAAVGITDDHESTTFQELAEKQTLFYLIHWIRLCQIRSILAGIWRQNRDRLLDFLTLQKVMQTTLFTFPAAFLPPIWPSHPMLRRLTAWSWKYRKTTSVRKPLPGISPFRMA